MNDPKILRPRPGGRSPAADEPTVIKPRDNDATLIRPRTPEPFAAIDGEEQTLIRPRRRGGSGTLTLRERATFSGHPAEQASSLLALALQLRRVQAAIDVPQLHRQAIRLVEQYRAALQASADGVHADASYLLCSLLDETVLNTAWGENSLWSQNSLLRLFHRETYGGEKVFQLIDTALGSARKDVDFLELAYLCLSLGFEGKYRIDPRGKVKLEQLRSDIYTTIKESRDRFRKELSPGVAPVLGIRRRLHSFASLWLMAGVLGLLVFGVYFYVLRDLNERSDRLMAELRALVPPAVAQVEMPEQRLRPEVVRLRELLAPEIERGVLSVNDFGNRVSVVLQAEAMFPSGSAAIEDGFLPILDKIGKALEIIPGRVVVTGHTDSSAIRTASFPSNWHLSLARASAVVKYMSAAASLRGRMLPEGRGDAEPIADNEKPEGRARNRRVTIDVHYATTGE